MIVITIKTEDQVIQSVTSGFAAFMFWTTLPGSLLGLFGHFIHGVHVVSTIDNDCPSNLWMGHSADTFNVIWNQFVFSLITEWRRMNMITVKAEDDSIQSLTSGLTPWVFGTTLPGSLFGHFGYPMHGVHVASTINQCRSSRLCSTHVTDTFNIIWN